LKIIKFYFSERSRYSVTRWNRNQHHARLVNTTAVTWSYSRTTTQPPSRSVSQPL